MNYQDFAQTTFNIISPTSFLQGDIILSGDTILYGKTKGTLRIEGQSSFVLERGASIHGQVSGHDFEIYGNIQGELKASGRVVIRSSANIEGKIEAAQLVIYPGAIINTESHTTEAAK